jgi:membrane peptidoglycan carboxypeptidase
MNRKRLTRRTYGGTVVPRHPAFPRMLRGRNAGNQDRPLPRIIAILLTTLLIAIGAVALGGVSVAYGAYSQVTDSLKPRLAAINNRDLFQTSRIYDRNGTLLYEFFDAGKRTKVTLDDVSPLLVQATVAIEDQSFFTNSGIDPSGIFRTLIDSLRAGEETGGASTITQQVIKNSVLTPEERLPERRYERKFKEIILAQELDSIYDKEQILELYLNENFYGNLAYGIEAASEVYFAISAADLNLAQAALLAGLPQLPTVYNPINHVIRDERGGYLPGVQLEAGWLDPEYQLPGEVSPPRWRQIAVLRRMVLDGYVEEPEARLAAAQPLRFAPQEVPLNAPHFVFYVRDLIQEQYGQQALFSGGLRITTTLDLDLQRMVQQKAYERINELEERNIHNAAVVVMQPNTGQILAMVGSIDYNAVIVTDTPGESGNVLDGQVNVTTRERQPGSALKPFTYLAAMEQGMTPETTLWDVPTEFPLSGGTWYAPQNYNGQWNGPVRMRTALANSLNMPAVKALKFAGIDNTLNLLDRVGIREGLKRGGGFYGLSLTLGGGEVTPLELATAYNTLASGGRYFPPLAVIEISAADGTVLERFEQSAGEQVVAPDLVRIISDMLSDDNARAAVWGLNSPLRLSLPAAVKTGTTNDWRDAWAAGYTPFVTVGVWTGNNNNEPTAQVESLSGGGIIWRNVMEEIFVWINENPRYQELFAEPFPDNVIPTEFTPLQDLELQREPICDLPGPFGNYNQEWFTTEMISATRSLTPTTALPGFDAPFVDRAAPGRIPCSAYDRITLVRIPAEEDWNDDGELQIVTPQPEAEEGADQTSDLSRLAEYDYCVPVEGESYPEPLVEQLYAWKLPPNDPAERVQYRWRGGSASTQVDPALLPVCTAEMFEPPIPVPPVAGAILMPDLTLLGENQAKEVLASLGISEDRIYVDYQTRARIPDVFDQYLPYQVISTLPGEGDWIIPGTTVILGIRAPDEQPQPTPQPDLARPTPAPDPGEPPPAPDPGEPPPAPDPGEPAPLPTILPLPAPPQPVPLPRP